MIQAINPIIPGFHPDPSICRVGEDYFLVTSSFEYFPGVPLYHSRDLAHWQHIGHCLTRSSQLPLEGAMPSDGIWAPTIRHHNGLFYMVTTNKTHGGNFYVTTSDPFGEWSEPVYFDRDGWDPSLFFDDDGTVYLTRNGEDGKGGWGIVQYPIDLRFGKPLESPRLIWNGTGFGPEAPHMFKRNGMYYLMIAEGGTHLGHYVSLARSASPWGPFETCPHNPILTHRNLLLHPFQAIGHADLVEAPDGTWWIVCLGIRNFGSLLHSLHTLGRETFLAPAAWDSSGWLAVNRNGTIPREVQLPFEPHPFPIPEPRQYFRRATLPLEWNFLRNPRPGCWSLTERPNWLTLHGTDSTLDSLASPTFIGRRQQHHRCLVRVRMDFASMGENGEAGLTVYMGPNYHYDLCMINLEGQRCIQLRRRVADLNMIAARQPVPNAPLILEISSTAQEYQFAWGPAETDLRPLARAQSKFLATEFTGGFTGIYFGLYAHQSTAWVDWFEYRGA